MIVFTKPPESFAPIVEVCGCYVSAEDKFLWIRRPAHARLAGQWGLPGGKLEKGEDAASAMVREIFEETGLVLKKEDLRPLEVVYVRGRCDFIYHIFECSHGQVPIILSDEHDAYVWLSLEEAITLTLIDGERECIELIYGKK